MSEAAAEETRTAGRGVLLIASAKLAFIVTGYVVNLGLPWLFGSREAYGFFGVAFGWVSIVNNVLIASTTQTLSKLVTEDEAHAPETLRQGLLLQTIIGVGLAAFWLGSAGWIAEYGLLDPALTPLFRIAAMVALAYALYASIVGYLNGTRQFHKQSGLDLTFSILRTTGLLAGAALGLGPIGAMGGFAAAAMGILTVALLFVGTGKAGSRIPLKRWLAFMWPIWIYQAFLNALMQIDLQVLKRTVTELASNGRSVEAAREIANAISGDYKAAQAFAFVPYQLILSVTFIVFPMVSKATTSGDEEGRRRYVRNAMRFSLLVLLSIATPIAGAADGVMRIAFPAAFVSGASALQMLVMGMVPFSLFVITATVLSSAGRPWIAALIAGGASIMAIALDRTLILVMGVEHATFATALGTSISTTTAMIAVGVIVRISYGAWIPPLSALRGLIAGGVGFVVAYYVPHQSRLTAILALAVGFFAYLATLAITGEIGKAEIASVQKIISRRGPGRPPS